VFQPRQQIKVNHTIARLDQRTIYELSFGRMMRDRTLELELALLPDLKRKRRIGGSRRRG
jgi:hypothetical protein